MAKDRWQTVDMCQNLGSYDYDTSGLNQINIFRAKSYL